MRRWLHLEPRPGPEPIYILDRDWGKMRRNPLIGADLTQTSAGFTWVRLGMEPSYEDRGFWRFLTRDGRSVIHQTHDGQGLVDRILMREGKA